MKQDNNTLRNESLKWWVNLGSGKAGELRDKYYPARPLLTADERLHIYLSEHPEQPIKEQSSTREEGYTRAKWYLIPDSVKLLRGFTDMVIAEMDINVTNELEEENKRLKERIEVLEGSFYMDICRAYNAGKQNALDMVAEGKKMGETVTSFISSHDYFKTEFPEFTVNVP